MGNLNSTANNDNDYDILTDIKYICKITPIVVEALRDGHLVAQLPNGDLIITEVKTVNTQYVWDAGKNKMIKGHQQ